MKATSFDRRTPAEEMLSRRRAWRQDDAHYEVVARDGGHRYEVTLQASGVLRCSCTAGHYGWPCWHEEKVARRLLREGLPDSILETDEDAEDEAWGRLA
ncbi:MAG: SWIM zinc finger family protein [Candidatus Dormibacteraceae bacterium]